MTECAIDTAWPHCNIRSRTAIYAPDTVERRDDLQRLCVIFVTEVTGQFLGLLLMMGSSKTT